MDQIKRNENGVPVTPNSDSERNPASSCLVAIVTSLSLILFFCLFSCISICSLVRPPVKDWGWGGGCLQRAAQVGGPVLAVCGKQQWVQRVERSFGSVVRRRAGRAMRLCGGGVQMRSCKITSLGLRKALIRTWERASLSVERSSLLHSPPLSGLLFSPLW